MNDGEAFYPLHPSTPFYVARESAFDALVQLAAERGREDAKDEAIRQLYWWIANQLDPDPASVEDYITDPDAQAAAKQAVRGR